MNKYTKLSKISYVVDILLQAKQQLNEALGVVNVEKRDSLLETITSAIDETYDLLNSEQGE